MTSETKTPVVTLDERPSGWESASVVDFVTEAARSIGVGSSTDAGWAPPVPAGTKPIMMTGGIPDPGTLPKDELLQAMQRVLDSAPADALRYGGYMGYEGLRQALADRYARVDGVPQGPENFVLTNGSAGGLDLISATYLNPGDIVVAESPTFSGSLRTFRGHQARLLGVPMDDDGIDTDQLEALLARQQAQGDPVKAVYTIPNYHNPTGTYLSLERRRHLVEISARYRVLILEDDAYGEIAFGEEPLPSLYSLAKGEGILRAATFSKTVATGLRVGWVQGRVDFIDACVRMRFDMGSSPLMHRMLEDFVSSGRWEAHIDTMRRIYARKCASLADALITEAEPYVRFLRPRGGFFLWVECLGGIDAARVAQIAAEEGALVVPGRNFFMDPQDGRSFLRLAFSTESPQDLHEGGVRLARALSRAASGE